MLFHLMNLAILAAHFVSATLESPPSTVVLIGPPPEAEYLFNSSVGVGFIDIGNGTYTGMFRNVSLYASYPNGTNFPLMSIFTTDCSTENFGRQASTTSFHADSEGQMAVHWNVTYGVSSVPAQSNKSYCGPGPLSFQSFILNSTITVKSKLNSTVNGDMLPVTVTTTLPTVPTGQVQHIYETSGQTSDMQPSQTGQVPQPSNGAFSRYKTNSVCLLLSAVTLALFSVAIL